MIRDLVKTFMHCQVASIWEYWSVRRLKASPTPPCGMFNIIISGRRGLGIQIVVLFCCLVALLLPYQSIKR